MIKDLIINLSLLVSILSVSAQFFKNYPMNENKKTQFVGGILMGFLGCTLMAFSVEMTSESIKVDLRHFAIIIASIYGGWLSLMTSAIIISIGRVVLYGIDINSITAIVIILTLSLLSYGLSKLDLDNMKNFFLLTMFNIIITDTAILFLIKEYALAIDVLTKYTIISSVGGFVIYSIVEYVVKVNESYRELQKYSTEDSLTGLNNVRQFNQLWEVCIQEAKEKKHQLSFLLIDIDYFKQVNDTYGHLVGDKVLKEVSDILVDIIQSTDYASRNGGEEFSVILPNCSNSKAMDIAENIRSAIEKHTFKISNEQTIKVTVSIGVATYPKTTDNLSRIIEIADNFLYKAKRNGRNQIYS